MVEQKVNTLLRKVFGLVTVAAVMGILIMIYVLPIFNDNPSFDGAVPTWPALFAFGSLAVSALAVLAILLFAVLPAVVDLVRAIQARREMNRELFP